MNTEPLRCPKCRHPLDVHHYKTKDQADQPLYGVQFRCRAPGCVVKIAKEISQADVAKAVLERGPDAWRHLYDGVDQAAIDETRTVE